jgi:hypothetical protein
MKTKGASARPPTRIAMCSSSPAIAYTIARVNAEMEMSADMVERISVLSCSLPDRYVAYSGPPAPNTVATAPPTIPVGMHHQGEIPPRTRGFRMLFRPIAMVNTASAGRR